MLDTQQISEPILHASTGISQLPGEALPWELGKPVAADVPSGSADCPIRQTLVWLVPIALAVRLIVSLFTYQGLIDASEGHFPFGWEVGRVASSLASGHGFSSPFQGETGPTAVLPPLYPLFVAGVFKLFGIYTTASAFVIVGIQGILSALTCLPVFFIAYRLFGLRVAKRAGWVWALFPHAVFLSAGTIWATTLSALLISVLFWLALRLREGAGWPSWTAYGLVWGMVALSNPALLVVAPALTAWVWYQLRQCRQSSLSRVAVATALAVLCIVPWTSRNYQTFGRWIPLRSNLGLELYVGNSTDTTEYWHASLHPAHDMRELQEMERLGESAYMAHKQEQAFEFIRQHPGTYAWLTLKRTAYFWTGAWSLSRGYLRQNPGEALNIPFTVLLSALTFAGLWRIFRLDRGTAWFFALALVAAPLLYYFVVVGIPYRHPIEPLMAILIAVGITGIDSPALSPAHVHRNQRDT